MSVSFTTSKLDEIMKDIDKKKNIDMFRKNPLGFIKFVISHRMTPETYIRQKVINLRTN